MNELCILDPTGDTKTLWDPNIPDGGIRPQPNWRKNMTATRLIGEARKTLEAAGARWTLDGPMLACNDDYELDELRQALDILRSPGLRQRAADEKLLSRLDRAEQEAIERGELDCDDCDEFIRHPLR